MYICDYKNCRREFTRLDHLKRHKVNHTTKRIKCDEPSCNMVFTRLDIKRKHERRHHKHLFQGKEPGHEGVMISNKAVFKVPKSVKPIQLSTMIHTPIVETPETQDFLSNVLTWLLDSDQASPKTIPSEQVSLDHHHFYPDEQLGFNSAHLMEEILAISPEFPTENLQTEIDHKLRFDMINYIPSLETHPDFTIPKIKWFLELYWLLYHSQYPILHRPSFSTLQTHPLLLLSMIMIGSSYTKKTVTSDHIQLVDANGLSLIIAEPLRWCIFASEYSKPPCQIWVIQSLIILETFEVACSTRSLHERAFIYSNVKIQLLRRNPILGGDPMKGVDSDNSKKIWNSWIEGECIKRAAFMSFNLDTIHAVVFGHPVLLTVNQLKLSLPCPDHIWEYNNINKQENVMETLLFVDSLKMLLNYESIKVDTFGRHLLLSGLMNLALQIEQNIQQWSNFGWKSFKEGWKDRFSNAIEFWKSQIPDSDCCLTLSSVYYLNATSPPLPNTLLPEDPICKFCVYHASQIYLKIPHYDYIVFAGAPKRMNVPISHDDYDIVVKRIDCWSGSMNGKNAVVNSLIFLCEMFIPNGIDYDYEPCVDPFIYRPNIVISSVLILWTYTFHKFGKDEEGGVKDGFGYLKNVCEGLRKTTSRGVSIFELDGLKMDEKAAVMKEYCLGLDSILGLNNTIGLLKILEEKYKRCEWKLGVEYSKLLGNCIRRSSGSNSVFCTDMYE